MSEKMRVHILAKELNVNSKAILDKCAAEGVPSVKNHMSTLSAGLEETIREWFSEGMHATTVETAERVNLEKVRVTRRQKQASSVSESTSSDSWGDGSTTDTAVIAEAPHETAIEDVPEREETEPHHPILEDRLASSPVSSPIAEMPLEMEIIPEPQAVPLFLDVPATAIAEPPLATHDELNAAVAVKPPESILSAPDVAQPPPPTSPAGPQNVPSPAKLRGPRVVRYEAPEYDTTHHPRGPVRSRLPDPAGPAIPGRTVARPDALRRGPGIAPTPAADAPAKPKVAGRRHRGSDALEKLREWNNRDLLERQERLAGATGRRIHVRRASEPSKPAGPAAKRTTAEVESPVTMKKFCAATGIAFTQLFGVLQREHNMVATMNSRLEDDLAQVVALEFGIELTVIAAKTSLDLLKDEYAGRPRPHLKRRPPVVTFLGHVDHGKTSLMDAIRRSRVAAGEEGGITQHIGSYHYRRGDLAITFLDTPGHKAFTAMRARGAQMTDIVVLVVSAGDGVQPQTVEAINHARAAAVPIVVALNKIDLPDVNLNRIYAQLSEQGLTPSGDWGGETDVIHTSATKGTGIDELLEHLHILADVKELVADPTVEAQGTVIEAETREGVGAVARVLVQEGTLKEGKVLVCGSAHGKVRALLDDLGERIKSAGPSIPVEVWGLDSVPLAGDPFFEVDSSQRAKMIAEETRTKRTVSGRGDTRKARSLEELLGRRNAEAKAELNLIIKADVDGSIEAIRHVLKDLPTDQVNLTIRHAGVGAVSDSDVVLADTCDGIIAAFHVVPVPGAKKLAEELGVDIRHYRVIYEVVDEIKKAMEGLLAPEQKEESRATVQVREVFRISKLGPVAGCYVSDGTVNRQQRARLIRDGVIVREGSKLASLRRFKDDVKEVREGMECGIRLEGFDDYKAGDVIETYEIISIARTL